MNMKEFTTVFMTMRTYWCPFCLF